MKATFNSFVFRLHRSRVFRFLGSLQLAIPLLLIVAAAVAWGTIVESKYNAEMAKIVVYQADWFSWLMSLLWLNIFCATVLRYPFKKHHTGFVITHIGLLLLLAGGVFTTAYGIDGSLAVTEGQDESLVSLPQLVFGVAPDNSMNYQTVEIRRSLSETSRFEGHNEVLGHIARLERYIPFAQVNNTYRSADLSEDVALGFILKSPFFNVSEFLHSSQVPSKQMGPALFELKKGSPSGQKITAKPANKPIQKIGLGEAFQVLNAQTGEVVHQLPIAQLKKAGRLKFRGIEVELKKAFRSAAVAGGGLSENEGSKPNPALELNVTIDGKSHREVVFARFPDFSLSREPAQEYKFRYAVNENAMAEVESESGPPAIGDGSGHRVRFYFDEKQTDQAQLELEKQGKVVLRQPIRPGETVQTPWMGMQVTLTSLIPRAVPVNEVTPTEPRQREEIPPGALLVAPKGASEPVWLAEGEAREVSVNGRGYSFYFGRKMFRLPFSVKLLKFYKKDYPGTETPMSFESDVSLNREILVRKISMNEPLDMQGYTLYQSSYQLNPNGGPAVSIFSVNYDPGRRLKYFGSLILCIGIMVFVIQRSSVYRNWQKRKAV